MRELFTAGHSVRPAAALVDMLRAHRIALVADVRSSPYSRRHPQFNRETLAATLAAGGLRYAHHPDLGGLRASRPDSPHRALEPGGFRGYADHMDGAAFVAALARLLEDAALARCAVLCAEQDPARCHRSLLADAATARGWAVTHLLSAETAVPHRPHPAAVFADGRVRYPGPPDLFERHGG